MIEELEFGGEPNRNDDFLPVSQPEITDLGGGEDQLEEYTYKKPAEPELPPGVPTDIPGLPGKKGVEKQPVRRSNDPRRYGPN